jgi:hypothetical protein
MLNGTHDPRVFEFFRPSVANWIHAISFITLPSSIRHTLFGWIDETWPRVPATDTIVVMYQRLQL